MKSLVNIFQVIVIQEGIIIYFYLYFNFFNINGFNFSNSIIRGGRKKTRER